MPLFAWDSPDASAGEDEHGENDEPEEDDQVELPTVDKIELKGAQEAYANTFGTDFDDENAVMCADFSETSPRSPVAQGPHKARPMRG